MNLGRYQLLAQVGVGRDGVSYRGCDSSNGSPVEIRVLSGARSEEDRWKLLAKRVRLAAMLDHPTVVGIRHLGLDHDPPFVVLECHEAKKLADALSTSLPLSNSTAVEFGRVLCGVLASAHRLGLAHGRLDPAAIGRIDGGSLKIDFTGLETNASEDESPVLPVDTFCRAPEHSDSRIPDSAADIYSLGALLAWLLTGSTAIPPTLPTTHSSAPGRNC